MDHYGVMPLQHFFLGGSYTAMNKTAVNNQNLGKHLFRCRKAKGISGNRLAKAAGLSQSTVSAIEQGQKSPTVKTLDALCAAMDMTLEEFFAGMDPVNRAGVDKEIAECLAKLTVAEKSKLLAFLREVGAPRRG